MTIQPPLKINNQSGIPLDWIIPLSERHLRKTLGSWMAHYPGDRAFLTLGQT